MADKKLDTPAYTSAVEVEKSEALQHLEKNMVIYGHAKIGGAAEDIALAMEDFATKHSDAKFKKAYRTKSRKATGDNRDVVVEDIGKGLMVLLTTLELYLLVRCLVGRVNVTRLGKSCQ